MEFSKRQEILKRGCGLMATITGLGVAAVSARLGVDALIAEPITAIERNTNDAQQIAAMLSVGASSIVASMGVMLATSPRN